MVLLLMSRYDSVAGTPGCVRGVVTKSLFRHCSMPMVMPEARVNLPDFRAASSSVVLGNKYSGVFHLKATFKRSSLLP